MDFHDIQIPWPHYRLPITACNIECNTTRWMQRSLTTYDILCKNMLTNICSSNIFDIKGKWNWSGYSFWVWKCQVTKSSSSLLSNSISQQFHTSLCTSACTPSYWVFWVIEEPLYFIMNVLSPFVSHDIILPHWAFIQRRMLVPGEKQWRWSPWRNKGFTIT